MIVWENTIDNRFKCIVERKDRYTGHLSVTDTKDGTTLLSEDVPLAYGAMFGPDVDDVDLWEKTAITIVDAKLSECSPPNEKPGQKENTGRVPKG